MERYRPSTHEWCISLSTFRAVPHARLCRMLRLQPARRNGDRRRAR